MARLERQVVFDLIKPKPSDLRGQISERLEAVYLYGIHSYVMEGPIDHCSSSLAYAYGADRQAL